jgi:hypothetical protein
VGAAGRVVSIPSNVRASTGMPGNREARYFVEQYSSACVPPEQVGLWHVLPLHRTTAACKLQFILGLRYVSTPVLSNARVTGRAAYCRSMEANGSTVCSDAGGVLEERSAS